MVYFKIAVANKSIKNYQAILFLKSVKRTMKYIKKHDV